jgi:hypothetical protein
LRRYANYFVIRLLALKEKLAHEKKHLSELEKTMYVPFTSASTSVDTMLTMLAVRNSARNPAARTTRRSRVTGMLNKELKDATTLVRPAFKAKLCLIGLNKVSIY